MSLQYIRQFSLVVARPDGEGYELGALRCVFEVRRGDSQTPNSCDVKIYNLSADTAKQINSPEFTQLALKAGYGDASALKSIFQGSITQVRLGREDQKNTYVAITAACADEAYNYAAVSDTLGANSTQDGSVGLLLKSMRSKFSSTPTGGTDGQQVVQGYKPTLNPAPRIRGRTHYGLCRDEMRDLAEAADCRWFIEDNASTLVPNTGYIPAAPLLITPFTGLIGVPETTQNGLELTVLLNPAVKIGQTIKLDYNNVNKLRYGTDYATVGTNLYLQQQVFTPNPSGLYYVMWAEHTGDTRGQPWYTRMVCLAVDASVTPGVVEKAFPAPNAIKRY